MIGLKLQCYFCEVYAKPHDLIINIYLYSGGLNLGKEGRKIHSACKADDDADSIESPEEDNASQTGMNFSSKIFQIQIG